MLKIQMILFCLFWLNTTTFAQSELRISGQIKVLEPTEIKVKTIDGKLLLACPLKSGETFSMGPKKIVPDVYLVYLGESCQPVYLSNAEVTIKGFYDSRHVEKSSLDFTGIDEYYEILKWLPEEKFAQLKTIKQEVAGKLTGNMYSALAYISDMSTYEPNKMLFDCMSEEALQTASGKWLRHRSDSLYHYSIGAEAFNFTFQNPAGEKISLSDFRGKLVLIDFWASWCGPCRSEMKSLLPIYNELKGDDLEFISISLDSKESHWRKMLDEEKLPWVMLWNEEGFVIGNKPNMIQRAYGFYSIPFIVLIDKEGKLLAKDLRGEKVREAILKARQE